MSILDDLRRLSDKQRVFTRKDAFIVSVPKSGRTWLRVLLHSYYGMALSSSQPSSSRDIYDDSRPAYYFTHDRYSHRTIANRWHRFIGRYLIPMERRRNGRIVLLARDPRDLMVSLYFQNTKRVGGDQVFRGTIHQMLRDPVFGIDCVISTMNGWMQEWGDAGDRFLLCRYEDMHADRAATFGEVIGFLGDGQMNMQALQEAIEQSRFERMQEREKSGGATQSALRPGDPADPESFKTRKGKVGAYTEYLEAADIAMIETAMRQLDSRFGYTVAPQP